MKSLSILGNGILRPGILALVMMECFFGSLHGQGELSLPTLPHILESDRYNPSISNGKEGVTFGLPGISYNAFHTGPGYHDIIKENGGIPTLQVTNLANGLMGANEVLTDFRFQGLKVKYRKARWSIGLEHEIVFHAQLIYPDALVELYVNGNQPWIGKTVSIAPEAMIFSYNNFALPISYHGTKFSLGIRPRILMGNQFGHTPQSDADLHTDEDFYQLTLKTNYIFENVGILDFRDANLLNYELNDLWQWKLFSDHVGLAIDFGLLWNLTDQARFALSISDLGYLRWKDVKTYQSQKTTEYRGIEVTDLFEIGQIDVVAALDSLDAIFDIVVGKETTRFSLPLKWHAHFSYQLNEMWQLSTSLTYQGGLLRPWNIGVIFTGEVMRDWFIGTSISNRYGHLGLGLHSSLSWGRFTGFLVSDQLLRGVNPLRANHFNVRAGINLSL